MPWNARRRFSLGRDQSPSTHWQYLAGLGGILGYLVWNAAHVLLDTSGAVAEHKFLAWRTRVVVGRRYDRTNAYWASLEREAT